MYYKINSKDYNTDFGFNLWPILKIGRFEIRHFTPGYSWELSFGTFPYPFLSIGIFGRMVIFRYISELHHEINKRKNNANN